MSASDIVGADKTMSGSVPTHLAITGNFLKNAIEGNSLYDFYAALDLADFLILRVNELVKNDVLWLGSLPFGYRMEIFVRKIRTRCPFFIICQL